MNKNIITLSLLALILSSIAIAMPFLKTKDIVYVDTNLLYEKFEGKIELEKEFSLYVNKQTTILDSLELNIKGLYDEYQIKPSKELEKSIILKEKNYDRLHQEFSKVSQEQREKYMKELWTQINQYVKEYGDKNKYTVILGANGTGSLMYSKKEIDITEELIEYINIKYAGE